MLSRDWSFVLPTELGITDSLALDYRFISPHPVIPTTVRFVPSSH